MTIQNVSCNKSKWIKSIAKSISRRWNPIDRVKLRGGNVVTYMKLKLSGAYQLHILKLTYN